ncbi:hypothetical protein [Flavobacterium sp. KACC 22763]|uniref:hypothetical protein n=1 Tax=Flavobacterium sp. KACC 22763 TaxID=3025668 RepID=UPI002365663D|nr:hypothetical protein [Flavobacterium sp. KACC 22763]WDF64347.1 hypothetical protein PQ463_22360 [Flavobacterium sp. KACC 22763]
MKFVKGQDVSYTALSGISYKGTIIERKMVFKKGLIIKSTSKESDFHYLIEIHKNGTTEKILCAENHLKLLEKKKRVAKKVA